MHFLSKNMRNILVPIFFFHLFQPPSSVQWYCLFYVTSSISYGVTFQFNDVHSEEAEVYIVIEIGLSLGILYSENRTLGIKDLH